MVSKGRNMSKLKLLPLTGMFRIAAEQTGPKSFKHYRLKAGDIIYSGKSEKNLFIERIKELEGRDIEFGEDVPDGRSENGQFHIEEMGHLLSPKARRIVSGGSKTMLMQAQEGRVLEMKAFNKINKVFYLVLSLIANFISFVARSSNIGMPVPTNAELDEAYGFMFEGYGEEGRVNPLEKYNRFPKFKKAADQLASDIKGFPRLLETKMYNKLIKRRLYPAFVMGRTVEFNPDQIKAAIQDIDAEIIKQKKKIKGSLNQLSALRLADTTGAGAPIAIFTIAHFDIPEGVAHQEMLKYASPLAVLEGDLPPTMDGKKPYSDFEITEIDLTGDRKVHYQFNSDLSPAMTKEEFELQQALKASAK
jgi:hypothetical protein